MLIFENITRALRAKKPAAPYAGRYLLRGEIR